MDEESNKKLVTVSYRLPFLCSEFVIDENFCISLMSQTTFGHLLCVGDQIIYVNGKSPKTPKDASNMMQKRGSDIIVTVFRQSNIFPVLNERAKKIGLKRRKGFHYFVALIQISSKQDSLGLAVRKVGEKVFVSKILTIGICGNILHLGDCVIDVDEKKVTSDAFLKKVLIKKLLATNECTLLIERIEYGRPQKKSTTSFLSRFTSEFDPEMPEDAAKIGMKQSKYFRENCRQPSVYPIAAKPILKSSNRKLSGSSNTGVTATITSSGSSNKKSVSIEQQKSSVIILEPKKEDIIKTKSLPPSPATTSTAKDQSAQSSTITAIAAAEAEPTTPNQPRHVRFKPSISSTLAIPSDYSNRKLEKVQKQSHSYTVKNDNNNNNMLNKQKNKKSV
uniref:PDZ domain-containing protein n=1 Tax=Panagrolaimus sp. ES5 TaxID=591445 RepID=A0AC34FNV0_9BILA